MDTQAIPTQPQTKSSVPQPVREWLQSETVTDIVVLLNASHYVLGDSVKKLPSLITAVATGRLAPEKFTPSLKEALPFLEDRQVLEIAAQVRDRILKPIAGALKSYLGIDSMKLGELPPSGLAARTMSVEGSLTHSLPHTSSPEQAPKPDIKPIQSAQLHARTMEIQGSFAPARNVATKIEVKKMIDIQGPGARQGVSPTAQVTQMQGSFSPVQATSAANIAKAPTPPTIRSPKQAADVLETPSPIGLSEVVPQAPKSEVVAESVKSPSIQPIQSPAVPAPIAPSQLPTTEHVAAPTTPEPHQIVRYQDEHPVVE